MNDIGMCEICGDIDELQDNVCSQCDNKYPLMD